MKTLIKYIISGSIAVSTRLVFLAVMVEIMHMPEIVASNLSFCVSVSINYLLQHRFVYKCEGKHSKHASRFIMVALTGLLINYIVFSYLLTVIDFYLLAQLITIILVFAFNFIVNTTFTFRKETV
ncbi:MAG TPA: GtrA family protein [Thiothrix sp.]|nr:GtrA family protein [Thiothrix sp.]